MTDQEARELAYQWHGGQWTPLYAFASSGLVRDRDSLMQEVKVCAATASAEDRYKLYRLNIYIEYNVRKTTEEEAWPHYVAPWGKA